MKLQAYFQPADFERALDSFAAARLDWPLRARYELYRLATVAFNDNVAEPERRTAVAAIYDQLVRNWGLLRGYPRTSCWNADQVFDTLVGCQRFGRARGVDLVNIDVAQNFTLILECVRRFDGIKPMTGDFPHMASSKLMHFFNPHLFPIYDRAEIWDNVCRRAFKREYDQFCNRHGFAIFERTSRFNVYYLSWASEIMKTVDPAIGTIFAAWFARHSGVDVNDVVVGDCDHYWAAMFEIAAIGAAHIEMTKAQEK